MQRLRQSLTKSEQTAPKVTVSQPTVEQLQAKLAAAYDAEITKAVSAFGTDLRGTSKQLSEEVSRLTTKVIEEELEAYQKTLEEVRHVATQAMNQIREAVEHQRIELRQGMEQELATERQHLIEKFDAKMGDVISSYISEALGSGVDLGAQMQFILTSLEAHKAEIRKDLSDGV
jgi:F0F1-type ATP synthase membrane subunit b/b'